MSENLYCKGQKGNSQQFNLNWETTFNKEKKDEHNHRRGIDEDRNSINGDRETNEGERHDGEEDKGHGARTHSDQGGVEAVQSRGV